jgi:hypothetical protein
MTLCIKENKSNNNKVIKRPYRTVKTAKLYMPGSLEPVNGQKWLVLAL